MCASTRIWGYRTFSGIFFGAGTRGRTSTHLLVLHALVPPKTCGVKSPRSIAFIAHGLACFPACKPAGLSVYRSVRPFIRQSVHPCAGPFICQSSRLCARPPIRSSVRPSVRTSVRCQLGGSERNKKDNLNTVRWSAQVHLFICLGAQRPSGRGGASIPVECSDGGRSK